MKKIIQALMITFILLTVFSSCEFVPLEEAPHSNPVDPDYESGDTTPPDPINLNAFSAEYYDGSIGVAISWPSPEEYVLLLRGNDSIPDNPLTDGTEYSSGDTIGGLAVLYAGNGASFTDTEFSSDGEYHYRLFAYDASSNYSSGGAAESATIYVDAVYVHWSGDDTSAGTSTEPLRSIQAGVDKADEIGTIGQVRVAGDPAETQIYTAGVAESVVTMKSGISIRGGYNPNDWADPPDLLTWPAILAVTGPVATPIATVRALDLASDEVLSGLRINGSDNSGMASYALHLDNADITVRGCEITGGGPNANPSYGIYIKNASPTISNNLSINGGSGTAAIGIHAEGTAADPSNPVIRDNNGSDTCITGGSTTGNVVGISFSSYTTGLIENNRIKAAEGQTATYSFGIRLFEASPVIRNNIIRGESTADVLNNIAYGLYVDSCNQGVIAYNNVISSENIRHAEALCINNSDVAIRNNTLRASNSSGSSWIINIVDTTTADDIYLQNNVIFAGAGGGTGINDGASPATEDTANTFAVERNNFSGTGVFFYNESAMIQYLSLADMDSGVLGCSANLNDPVTLAADGQVTNGTPESMSFAGSGLDGAAQIPAWNFAVDMAGASRTGDGTFGWSMGAYEYD